MLSYTPNNLEAHKRLKQQLSKMMNSTSCVFHGAGCHQGLFDRNVFIGQQIPLAGVAHQNGTVRFGDDPLTSALDIHCKAHDIDNLYVVDGSFFPSSGAVNPGLTIVANALRVGDHLLQRMHARKGATGDAGMKHLALNALSIPLRGHSQCAGAASSDPRWLSIHLDGLARPGCHVLYKGARLPSLKTEDSSSSRGWLLAASGQGADCQAFHSATNAWNYRIQFTERAPFPGFARQ